MQIDRPTVITSISPVITRGLPASNDNGLAYQKRCVDSWLNAGARVISVNNRVEMAILDEDYPGVEFVKSAAVKGAGNPKGLPHIAELLELGFALAPGTPFAVTNSDVEFPGRCGGARLTQAEGARGEVAIGAAQAE